MTTQENIFNIEHKEFLFNRKSGNMLYMEPTKRYTLKSFPFAPVDDPQAINTKYEDIMKEYPDAQFKQVLNVDGILGIMLMFV